MPKLDRTAAAQRQGSRYPLPFRGLSANRLKQALGDLGGLTDFGVNLVFLPPGEWSSQRHWHSTEDEFVYVLAGEITLIEDGGATLLMPGDCAAFPKSVANGHHLINRSDEPAQYLEIGARRPAEDVCHYPDIDMEMRKGRFWHKDGTPY